MNPVRQVVLPRRTASPATPGDLEDKIALRSRMAALALVLVLLAVSVFAVWSSQATRQASVRAITASKLSDAYADAANALTGEESLERKYRLEPGPDVQAKYYEAATGFVTALQAVRQDGAPRDQAFATAILLRHSDYLTTIDRMFRMIDRGSTGLGLQIEKTGVDPSFALIEQAVSQAADTKHAVALAQLDRLQHLESATATITPVVFLIGIAIAVLLGSIMRGQRRLLQAERSQALHASLHDALTTLPNRSLLADLLGQALQASTSTGLLVIDLDRFKEINDTFGHHNGDALLRRVGPRLASALRKGDTIARLGGDEFAVLLPDVSSVHEVLAVANKLRLVLQEPFTVETIDLHVEASIGVVCSSEHGHDPAAILQRADIAMYVAKTQQLGVFAYNPSSDGNSPTKLTLLSDLHRALGRKELVLHYQPKVSISSGEVVCVEALIRWQHPEHGMIFPDTFIPMAENTGLIGPLTLYVLDVALSQARVWADIGQPLPVSVNFSARNLLDEQLPTQVSELLEVHGVGAELLQVEVTESALMTEPTRAQQLLQQLSELGVKISIDDFGAGYTSLGQLKTLPIDELKIDKSFVMTMSTDHSNSLIVHSLIDLAHNLGLTIVAEGVEDEQTLTALAKFGCDLAQGYHHSRPLPAADLCSWLQERRPTPQQTPPANLRLGAALG